MPNNEYEFKYWKTQGIKRGIDPYETLVRLFGISSSEMWGQTVLDVGCGYFGGVLSVLPCKGLGVDVLAKQYRAAGSTAPIMQVKDEHLPFPDHSFDSVFCANALDHMSSPCRSLREIRRVLRPGGRFYLQIHARRKEELNIGHPVSFPVRTIRRMTRRFRCIWDAVYSYDLVDECKYKTFIGVYSNG